MPYAGSNGSDNNEEGSIPLYGNSCRSQMAEGWARALKGHVIEAYSAGIETHGLNPNAVKVMAEVGVDISGHRSKRVDELKDVDFDVVVTVCGHAHETCPMWLGGKAKVIHVGFDDPPALALELAAKGVNETEPLDCNRRVRDAIKVYVAQDFENERRVEQIICNCSGWGGFRFRGSGENRKNQTSKMPVPLLLPDFLFEFPEP
jgi:arsenate reductase